MGNPRRKQQDDDVDDASSGVLSMSLSNENGLESTKSDKKSKKSKKGAMESASDDDDDSSLVESKKNFKKTKASFSLLMMDDDDNDDDDDDDSGSEKKVLDSEEPKAIILESVAPTKPSKKSKDKKKKKGKDKELDDDIEAILADIEKPSESKSSKKKKKKNAESVETVQSETTPGEGTEETLPTVPKEAEVVTMEDLYPDSDDDKKKKKKKKKKDIVEDEEADNDGGEDDGDGKLKSASQKRKEKKEREKLKKQQDKMKEVKKSKKETSVAKKTDDDIDVDDASREGSVEQESSSKKKKKGKKEKEEKETTKKPKGGQIARIREALEKMKEEEEKLRKEEEERERLAEERRLQKEEQKRLEEERKERKKMKEKLKKERLKAEGKLLTEKQKHERRRAQQMLEAMRNQGVELPVKDGTTVKKRIVYADKKKKKPQPDSDSKKEDSPTPSDDSKATEVIEMPDVTEEISGLKEQEKSSIKEVKESWDLSSEEEEEELETTVKMKDDDETKESDDDDDEDDEDDDEDDDDEDDEDESSEESSEEESSSDDERTPAQRAKEKIMKRREAADKRRTTDVLRAPVVCVLGHVDTGKTKILDKLRRTHVQDGEAGGITQQIGATNVPHEALKDATKMCKEFQKQPLKLPGLLIIDTPGHESFSNLRSRGSSLCDIAILVVDIMHGLEPQTIESINLLKSRKTPFVIALNKVDRLFQWKTSPHTDFQNTIKKQSVNTKMEFDERSKEAILQISEQGLNAALFYENKNVREYINVVPTSAHTGDGMGNLIATICELTQNLLAKRLAYGEELDATVMEVKALPGMGTTIDVILVNGKLKEGDSIVVAGTEGPIVTQIRGLLTPQPMRELRVKATYQHHKEIMAAQGVKIMAKDLEKALAGLPLYVPKDHDEIEYYKEDVANALKEVLSGIKLQERGVFVQASTLGSLEALLEFLRTSKIPYAGINIGPIHKKDIMKASVMLEHDNQYAVILAFDVKIEPAAQELADTLGVRIFSADIIYHLFDQFMAYREELKKKRQEEFRYVAVFPCKIRVMPQYIFNSRDPIVVGVCVEAGFIKEGTPLCVPSKEFVEIGRVTSIENNHKNVDVAKKGQEVCIKIEPIPGEAPKMFGRHFDHTDILMSKISRQSIDAVKDYFRDEMTKTDWQLILELKKLFQII